VSEFEDRLNSILGDPSQMEKIAAMAQSLLGAQEPPKQKSEPTPTTVTGLGESFDPALLGRLTGALAGGGGSDHKQALLEAVKPYLSQKRREKLERAMKLAKMIHVAEIAFGAWGGGDNAQI